MNKAQHRCWKRTEQTRGRVLPTPLSGKFSWAQTSKACLQQGRAHWHMHCPVWCPDWCVVRHILCISNSLEVAQKCPQSLHNRGSFGVWFKNHHQQNSNSKGKHYKSAKSGKSLDSGPSFVAWSSFYDELNTESENPQISWKYVLNMNLESNPIVQVYYSSLYTLLAGHPVYDYSFISGKHNLSIAMSTDSHLQHIFCFHL